MAMAVITPLLTAAGASASTIAAVGTGVSVAGSVAGTALTGISLLQGVVGSGYAQQAGYQFQQEGIKKQADMERLKAQEEGNLRRERLLNALAAQNSRSGAAGITGGTPAALSLKSMEDYERDQSQSDLMQQSTQSMLSRQRQGLKLQGKEAVKSGWQNLATGIGRIGMT